MVFFYTMDQICFDNFECVFNCFPGSKTFKINYVIITNEVQCQYFWIILCRKSILSPVSVLFLLHHWWFKMSQFDHNILSLNNINLSSEKFFLQMRLCKHLFEVDLLIFASIIVEKIIGKCEITFILLGWYGILYFWQFNAFIIILRDGLFYFNILRFDGFLLTLRLNKRSRVLFKVTEVQSWFNFATSI